MYDRRQRIFCNQRLYSMRARSTVYPKLVRQSRSICGVTDLSSNSTETRLPLLSVSTDSTPSHEL